jgi:hypothetical protein
VILVVRWLAGHIYRRNPVVPHYLLLLLLESSSSDRTSPKYHQCPMPFSVVVGGIGIGTDAELGEQPTHEDGRIVPDGLVEGEENDGRKACGDDWL